MYADYVSLADLAKRIDVYESMPVRLQTALSQSIKLTLITNVVSIAVLLLAQTFLYPINGGFFGIVDFTEDAANWLIWAIHTLTPVLLALNIVSLILVGLVLLISWGMTRAVREPVHWMAWVAAIPSGATALAGVLLTTLFALLIVVTIVIWIVAIMITLMVLGALLSALVSS